MKDLTKSELETILLYLGWEILDDNEYPPEYDGDTWQKLMISHEWEANNPKSCMDIFLSSLETEDIIQALKEFSPKCGLGQKTAFKERNEAQIRLTIHILETTAGLDDFAEDIRRRASKAGYNVIFFDEEGKFSYEELHNEKIKVKAPLLIFSGEGEDIFEWYDPKPHDEDKIHAVRCIPVSLKECDTPDKIAEKIAEYKDGIEKKYERHKKEVDTAPDWIEDNDERCRIYDLADYCDEALFQLPLMEKLIEEMTENAF